MKILVVFALVLCGSLAGCSKQMTEPAQVAKVEAAPASSPGSTKVEKIVFVGKEHDCACTRKAIDASWKALQAALGAPAKVPVLQLKVDTESAKVEPYEKQKAIMALPAIYFLDEQGISIENLQGEVTVDQIKAAFAKK